MYIQTYSLPKFKKQNIKHLILLKCIVMTLIFPLYLQSKITIRKRNILSFNFHQFGILCKKHLVEDIGIIIETKIILYQFV